MFSKQTRMASETNVQLKAYLGLFTDARVARVLLYFGSTSRLNSAGAY